MDEEQYDHFSKCRTQNFLSKGKEAFIEWAKIKWSKNFIEFIAHLTYNEVRSIIEHSIRSLDDSHNLHKLSCPLTVDQIQRSVSIRKEEIDNMISQVNLAKGMRLFIKEYLKYYKFKEHYQRTWEGCLNVWKNKKKASVTITIK